MKLFPSPIGELHFSMENGDYFKWVTLVSVPYRGATFLNLIKGNTSNIFSCFRPLSGSYISQ